MYKLIHYIYLGAASSLAAASTIRRLADTCGPILLTQVLAHTTWITIVAMSSQPATVTVSTAFQSAVSPDNFRGWRSMLWRGDPEPGKARKSGAHPWRRAERTRPEAEHERQLPKDNIIIQKKNQNSLSTQFSP